MKFKKLISIIICCCISLFLPIMASAAAVLWSSESYRAYVYAQEFPNVYNESEVFGPPLPISEHVFDPGPGIADAISEIRDTDIFVGAGGYYAMSKTPYSNAVAEFSGTYTASDSIFQFSYSYTFEYVNRIESASSIWINIDDLTDTSTLYSYAIQFDSSAALSGSDVISINTPIGHDISVSFGAEVESKAYNGSNANRIYLTSYEMTVVPEPVSSILFITGGTLLSGRRYLKRKKKV